jgi:hypothetical protein
MNIPGQNRCQAKVCVAPGISTAEHSIPDIPLVASLSQLACQFLKREYAANGLDQWLLTNRILRTRDDYELHPCGNEGAQINNREHQL